MITTFFKSKDGEAKQAKRAAPSRDSGWTPAPLPSPEEVSYADLRAHMEPEWAAALAGEFEKAYWKELSAFLVKAEAGGKGKKIFPPRHLTLNAFRLTPLSRVRVCILGQDPYHGAGQAEGLSFSVPRGQAVPSSLRNIFKELGTDVPGFRKPSHGSLTRWAEQGVLMLNTVLTVEQNAANSHRKKGWETFTSQAIRAVAEKKDPVVFVLWGKQAQANAKLIERAGAGRHRILQSAHPSGLSAHRGFFGSRCFSKVNSLLAGWGFEPVDWNTDGK